MHQDTVAEYISSIRKGRIFIQMKDKSKVFGKFLDITPLEIIVDCDIFYNAILKSKNVHMGRVNVEKKHIERYLISFDGGKKREE
jgi:hypothetical protein